MVIGCTGNSQPLQYSLESVSRWSIMHDLHLNTSKCLYVNFTLRSHTSPSSFSPHTLTLHDSPIPTSTFVTYLGVKFSNNLSWTSHVAEVFFKVRRLSFYALKLRKLSVHSDIIFKFVYSCILLLWFYCSPIIFPGLLSKDFILFTRSLKHLAK